MISAYNLSKLFGDFIALDHFHTTIPDGTIYGLVGSNGSGKSTLLRLIAGIYRPDSGGVELNGEPVFENPAVKKQILYVADDLFFFPQATTNDMAAFYGSLYESFDIQVYKETCARFPIDPRRKIHTFSKGMRRQVALILALSCRPKVLLLDEAFDGLDPVIRGGLRDILAAQIATYSTTVVIASHNLRELEDLCDFMGLLHHGQVLFEKEIDEVKLGYCKIQAAFQKIPPEFPGLDVMQRVQIGSVLHLVVRGDSEDILNRLHTLQPIFAETIPLTLEEVFIHEMEVAGYDYHKVLH